jgi:peptide/nickel transport system permease protein
MDVDALAAEAVVPEVPRPLRRAKNPHLWIVRRILIGLLTLLVASILIFAATQALPSDPARAILGRDATPQTLVALRQQLGLDKPLVEQYTSWLGGAVHGDFGESLAARRPVSGLIGDRVVNSLVLLALVALIALPLALALGIAMAVRRDRGADRIVLLGSLGLTALPEFVIGMGLIILLATTVFQVFPAVSLLAPGESPLADPSKLILPVLTLVLAVVPYLYRLVRASTIEALESEYVVMARLKGMPEHSVVLRHVLPNALVPVIQASALVLTYLLGSAVVVESLFQFPGLGSDLTGAISHRDLPVMQAYVLVLAAAVVLFNLMADVLTVLVTPRLRTEGAR